MSTPEQRRKVSHGWTAGMLAVSVVILIGVGRNLPPEVILGRAVLAGLGIGLLGWGVSWVVQQLSKVS